MKRTWQITKTRVAGAFWRLAAASTGLAVRHPRTTRWLPVMLLALAAFVAGRAAGHILFLIL